MSVDVIQAEYEQLADIANRFGQQAEASSEMINRLQQRVAQLQQGGWIGAGVDAFSREMEGEVFPALQRLTGALEQARDTTNNIKDVLKTSEDEAARLFDGQLDSVGLGVGAAGIGGSVAAGVAISNGKQPFNWFGAINSYVGKASKFLDKKNWSKLANILESVTGQTKFTKQLGKLSELLDNPKIAATSKWLGRIGEGLDFAGNVYDAMNKGESFQQALITEGAVQLFKKGLYAVPVVGQAMAIYDGAMLVGNLAATGLEMLGFEETAVKLQNTLDTFNIDRYLNQGADILYEKAAPIVENAYNAVKDYGAGLIDDAQEVVGDTIDKVGDFADDVAEKLNPMNWF